MLLVASAALARHSSGAHVVASSRSGYRLGVAVATALLAPGWEPRRRKYVGEHAHYDGHPLYQRLIRELRQAGAAGATSLRGVCGYHGDHQPHGDSFWRLRRRVPVVTVIVDTPERVRRWFTIVDRLTAETGLVTSEVVPAFRATAPEFESGGLRPRSGSALMPVSADHHDDLRRSRVTVRERSSCSPRPDPSSDAVSRAPRRSAARDAP